MKQISLIIPTKNGYIMMPFDLNLCFTAQKAQEKIDTAVDFDQLVMCLKEIYGDKNANK